VIAVLGGISAVVSVGLAGDQPQWGQAWSRNMVSQEKNLPESFEPATGRNIRWMATLGSETHSTPVIANGRVLIGTNNEHPRDPRHQGDRSVLMCLDEKTGALLWQLVVPKLTNSIYWDWPRAGICSTPTVECNRVYLVSNRGEVLCLDLFGMANGNDGPYRDEARHAVPAGAEPVPVTSSDADILWAFDYIKECGVRQHDQAHGSPLVYGRFLYVNTSNGVDDSHLRIDSPDAPSLIVLDKETGRLAATDNERIGPRIFHSTWSSPALAEVQGRSQIIFCGGDGVVYAFEPLEAEPGSPRPQQQNQAAGPAAKLKKIWQFDCDPGGPKENVHRYHSNRKEGPSNVKSLPVFDHTRVYVTVGGDLWWGKNEAWLKCIDASRTGDITRTGEIWSYPLERHCMSTPAVHDGLVFVGDSGKRIHCVDAETGKPYWTEDVKGEVWASPLVADGKVYFATRAGELLVFAEAKQKKLLHRTQLDSPISSTPVAANGVLYVATMKQLYAVGK
jgi:outer membrane protein assembly factor BamB